MKTRAELFSIFQKFYAEILTQFNISIRVLRSDNAREFLKDLMILFSIDVPKSPLYMVLGLLVIFSVQQLSHPLEMQTVISLWNNRMMKYAITFQKI